MYDPHSLHAEEFIDHEEVQETLAWAAEHARDAGLIDSILAKAALCKGLSHREASVLLACELPDRVEALYRLANRIKLGSGERRGPGYYHQCLPSFPQRPGEQY